MSKVLVDRELLPCPFCGETLRVNNANLAVHSRDSDCLLRQQPVVVDDPAQVDRWNRRAQPAEAEGVTGDSRVPDAFEVARHSKRLVEQLRTELSAVTAERDRHLANAYALCAETVAKGEQIEQLRAEVDALRKDAERWRYVSLHGDDMHWLNLLRVDLDDFGGNINAAVDALIDGEAPAMAAKEA